MKVYFFILSLFFCGISFAQNTISGSVTDNNGLPLPGANIAIVGESIGTISDSDGKFSLNTSKQPPYAIEISSVGFTTQKVNITSNNQKVAVKLLEEENKLNEIVVSASRTPERVLESPVTIERMGLQEIRNTSSPSFYDGLENLKEVHFNTSSLSFKSINTRGFATVANTRFMQLVDGMDNSSPALNFVLGNLIGLSELDVASVELLPGASSALYGANAFNGILFMNSRSPFTSQGLSAYYKQGITSQEAAGDNVYRDLGVRAAHAFTPHFAMKANFNYMSGTEWIANDSRSMTGGTSHLDNQNFDGLNTYGDEVTTFIPNVGQVSRTGYREQDLTDNKIESVKADFSVHIKPWANDFEIILQHKLGFGNTIYQGANRYSLKDFYMDQTKVEVKGKNFFVRGYMTTEDAGNSYDMRFAGWNVNRLAKSDVGWFTDYATAFQLSSAIMGANTNDASAIARNYADNNILPTQIQGLPQFANGPSGSARFVPGTSEYNNALASVTSNPDLTRGAKFQDESKIYHADANYNFKDMIDFAEFQVGGSVRQYELNSKGTIFTDFDGPITYDEFGVYGQIQKKFMEDRLKFTGSVRYDKSQNFEGQFSPRISFVYSAGAQKNHNFRASFQTGFRNPTTQDQYIGLDLGPFALIGSAPENLDRYVETMNVSLAGQLIPGVEATRTLTGNDAYNSPVYSVPSVTRFSQTGNTADLEVVNINLVKPEQVKAFEVGYKSILENGLSVDMNVYYNIYNDFMSTSRVIKPYYGEVQENPTIDDDVVKALSNGDRRVYQVYTNTSESVSSMGFGLGLSKKVYKDFEVGANYSHSQFEFDQSKDPSFIAGFNTPKHRVKASLGNTKVFKNFGFNVNVRWNSEYLWQASFADGMVPENTVLDAQINYAIPAIKSVLKLGAANLFGKDYIQVIGAGAIGQQLFASLTINP
ncbi:outer membrane receptor for ferrienterochelin and colicin [Flavobacterium arsenatis]|uniref:Outer membrane receptor for ferrienterochelin and colicin n=1 Tax=Flavobacterium arsenatis TaxID=1484332 RepID=A0ABU1TLF3_9FLAO|nr:carboxypeptidase-like regulatory domain-containing protein [Flavobacterium arsenatis]MDR6966693.1 outer membrane receptor for ferrienterochelin and colicin [Flavobacterium arsenatis]